MRTITDILIAMLTALIMVLLYHTVPFLTLLPALILSWALSGDELNAYRRGHIAALKEVNTYLDRHMKPKD